MTSNKVPSGKWSEGKHFFNTKLILELIENNDKTPSNM